MSKTQDEQKERIQRIDFLAKERGISREELTSMLKDAVCAAARKGVHAYQNVDVQVDSKMNFTCFAKLFVVEKVKDPSLEIDLKTAQTKFPDAQIGQEVEWKVEIKGLGRIAADQARQNFTSGLRDAEKRHIISQFAGQEGQLVSGKVARRDKYGVWIDLGSGEGLMEPKDCIPGEQYESGDHITALLKGFHHEKKGDGVFLTRNNNLFVQRLFEREVSEIADGTVEIKGIAREPGYRTKIAVYSEQAKVDPVGACVGLRGARVRMIVSELGGEKVDIVNWNPDIRIYAENALKPAKLAKVFIDEKNGERVLQVRVAEDQLSLTIGKKGQNSRLAKKLLGWEIEVQKLEENEAPQQKVSMEQMIAQTAEMFAENCGVTPEVGRVLVINGYHSIEGLREASQQELAGIEGIGPENAAIIVAAVAK